MYSYISRKPAVLTIEAIADSEVRLLSWDNQQLLFEKVPKFERFFRILIENALVANQQRLIDNLSSTAEQRYLHFIKKYPLIPSCVPQHNIASYLGITPEFLSKIRRRLAKKSLKFECSRFLIHHRGTESTKLHGEFTLFVKLCALCGSVVKFHKNQEALLKLGSDSLYFTARIRKTKISTMERIKLRLRSTLNW